MNLPRGVKLGRKDTRQLCHNASDNLIELHKVNYKAAGLKHLAKGEVTHSAKLKFGVLVTPKLKHVTYLVLNM
jgi:hypothetical protein